MAMRFEFAVFVDRDGTICFDRHYLADPDGLELIPTVAEGIARLNQENVPVVIVTNQSGVGRGYFSEKELDQVHSRLTSMLESKGARIDDLFYCPHKPDAGCPCRKPAPGMLLQAKERHDFDLRKSFVIGDRMMDVEMAHSVGATAILVPEPGDQYDVEKEIRASKHKPDFRAKTFIEAVDFIMKTLRERTT